MNSRTKQLFELVPSVGSFSTLLEGIGLQRHWSEGIGLFYVTQIHNLLKNNWNCSTTAVATSMISFAAGIHLFQAAHPRLQSLLSGFLINSFQPLFDMGPFRNPIERRCLYNAAFW